MLQINSNRFQRLYPLISFLFKIEGLCQLTTIRYHWKSITQAYIKLISIWTVSTNRQFCRLGTKYLESYIHYATTSCIYSMIHTSPQRSPEVDALARYWWLMTTSSLWTWRWDILMLDFPATQCDRSVRMDLDVRMEWSFIKPSADDEPFSLKWRLPKLLFLFNRYCISPLLMCVNNIMLVSRWFDERWILDSKSLVCHEPYSCSSFTDSSTATFVYPYSIPVSVSCLISLIRFLDGYLVTVVRR